MIRLLDVVAVVMEKICCWCFVCFSEATRPSLNSGRTDGNISLCSSKTLDCCFQVTECRSVCLLLLLSLPFLSLSAHRQDVSGDGFSQTRQVHSAQWRPANKLTHLKLSSQSKPFYTTVLVLWKAYWVWLKKDIKVYLYVCTVCPFLILVPWKLNALHL